jgi:hypothetical protein
MYRISDFHSGDYEAHFLLDFNAIWFRGTRQFGAI